MEDREENVTGSSFFLNRLPVELRNQIYGHFIGVVQSGTRVIDGELIFMTRGDEQSDIFNLIHVCQQIREEMFCLLVEGRILRLHLRDLARFRRTKISRLFFNTSVSIETPFIIEVTLNSLPYRRSSYEVYIDNFLKFVLARPNVQLRFTAAWTRNIYGCFPPLTGSPQLDHLNRVFAPERRESWVSLLKSHIVEMRLSAIISPGELLTHMLLVSKKGLSTTQLVDLGFYEDNINVGQRYQPWRHPDYLLIDGLSYKEHYGITYEENESIVQSLPGRK